MKKETLLNKMKAIRDKAINTTATIIAAPAIIKSKRSIAQSTRDFNTLREARKYKGAPEYDNSGRVTDALKARLLADEVKDRLKKNK